jgi:class 3 adenylate cyclase
MEPQVQYAKTKDGVNIAYWTIGEGTPPLVEMPTIPFSHIQAEWEVPEVRAFYERLAARRKLVRYDGRGMGLSDRDVADYSLDAHLRDLDTVVDRLGLESFDLFAAATAGLVAATYAARHPARVAHLALWHCWSRSPDYFASSPMVAIRELADRDWETYTETAAHRIYGWTEGEVAHRMALFIRECIAKEAFPDLWEPFREIDLTSLLPEITSPALVLHRRQYEVLPVDHARDLASGIPNARLMLLEGASWGPFLGNVDAVHNAIDDFLGEDEEAEAGAEPPETGAFRTVLFTDVEGSTALTDRLGDARAREVLREHERITRDALKAHGGSEVKALGDGFMASFSSATKALECAIAMQRAFAEHNEDSLRSQGSPSTGSGRTELKVRIGLNAGEPIAEDDPDGRVDLFGTAVNMAARIAAKASGGEILTSYTVRGLVAGKGFLFSDRGDTALRGFEDPVRLYDVRWREER